MSEQSTDSAAVAPVTPAPPVMPPPAPQPPAGGGLGELAASVSTLFAQRPEVAIAAAFIGGFVIARIVKRLGH